MFFDITTARIFIKPGPTDLRKHQAGLAAVVQNILKADPFNGSVYLFCNRRRNLIKLLYWEKNGFCMWQKRLEQDTFPWPKNTTEAEEISSGQLYLVLEGLDIWRVHKEIRYTEV